METQQLIVTALTLVLQLYENYKAQQSLKNQTAISFEDFQKMAQNKANQIVQLADSEIAKAEADLNQ